MQKASIQFLPPNTEPFCARERVETCAEEPGKPRFAVAFSEFAKQRHGAQQSRHGGSRIRRRADVLSAASLVVDEARDVADSIGGG